MPTLILILLAAGLVGWLVATWWLAPDRVTFRDVLDNCVDDVRHLFDRLTNLVFVGVSSLGLFVVQNDDVRTVLLQSENRWGLGLLIFLALFTSPTARKG